LSKVKLLLDVVRDMRSLADSLQALADATQQNEVEVTDAVPETTDKPVSPEKKLTITDVRAVLGRKVTTEAKALLTKFGVNKLSEINPGVYGQLLMEAEGLSDAT
jgi:hypothetical protein